MKPAAIILGVIWSASQLFSWCNYDINFLCRILTVCCARLIGKQWPHWAVTQQVKKSSVLLHKICNSEPVPQWHLKRKQQMHFLVKIAFTFAYFIWVLELKGRNKIDLNCFCLPVDRKGRLGHSFLPKAKLLLLHKVGEKQLNSFFRISSQFYQFQASCGRRKREAD